MNAQFAVLPAHPRILAAAAGLAILGTPGEVLAQASFTEYFDDLGSAQSGHGPAALVSRGWQFRNQSQPLGSGDWYAADYSQAGAGCIVVDSSVVAWSGTGSMGSSWALLPVIPNQQAGDPISFWINDGYMTTGRYSRLQVRYSPSGGTGTGTAPEDVGDYTQLLLDIPNVNNRPWTKFETIAPGTGRLALRLVQPSGPLSQSYGGFSIDTLEIGSVAGPLFPVPAPGQTVHWTAAHSPVLIDYDLTIPGGGTVVVDPGVEVILSPMVKLHIDGRIVAGAGTRFVVPTDARFNINGEVVLAGTAAAPVHLDGGPAWGGGENGYQVKRTGRLLINHVRLNALIKGAPFNYLTGGSEISADHITVECQDCGFYVDRGTFGLRNAQFNGGFIYAQESYVSLDQVEFDNALFRSERFSAGQPLYINNVTARNVASGAPFRFMGFDHFFGPDNAIENNRVPVRLDGAGIAPGSTLPASGNLNNYLDAGFGEGGGKITYANIGLPYVVVLPSGYLPELSGTLRIEPGVTVRMGPGALLWAVGGDRVIAEGLPDAPITFEQLIPGQKFQGLYFAINRTRPKLEYCTIRGGTLATIADETRVRIESCLYEQNDVAIFSSNLGVSLPRKTRIHANTVGVRTSPGFSGLRSGHTNLYSPTNPNSVAGNSQWGVEVQNQLNIEPAGGVWWGHPSGPQHPQNPSGQGDRATSNASVFPFLTEPPDFADRPPLVRLEDSSFMLDAGTKVILRWAASDDSEISGFRIYHSPHGENPGLSLLIDSIPGSARSWEVEVPPAPPASNYTDPSAFRVEAVDDSGQTGFDEITFFTPYLDSSPSVITNPIAGPWRPGERPEVCFADFANISGMSGGFTTEARLFLDADEQSFSLGTTFSSGGCMTARLTMPPVSTDTARIGVRFNLGAGGRLYWAFSPNFEIRPDPAITGDTPPQVQLISPTSGQTFTGGDVVPVSWSASDDEGLRSFDLQASYDGGRTWQPVVRGLPGSATSFDWRLPPSGGIPQARVRVIARDRRFQNTSSGAAITILPGGPGACYANCDGSSTQPVLNVGDFTCFLSRFAAGDPYANCDQSTTAPTLNVADFSCFLSRFAAGCP